MMGDIKHEKPKKKTVRFMPEDEVIVDTERFDTWANEIHNKHL